MKEKTFEELIEENSILLRKDDTNRIVSDDDVLTLLKQVREATIAECRKCLTIEGHDDVPMSFFEQKYKMNQVPTDRIKTDL